MTRPLAIASAIAVSPTGAAGATPSPEHRWSLEKGAWRVIQVADPSGRSARLSFAGADRLAIAGGVAYLHQRGKLRSLDLAPHGALQDAIRRLEEKSQVERAQIEKLIKRKAGDEATALMDSVTRDREAMEALNEKLPECFLWDTEAPAPFDLIFAGGVVLVGGDREVAAFSADDGGLLWRAEVVGKCYGLAVAEGRLFASTSRGHIYCFTPES